MKLSQNQIKILRSAAKIQEKLAAAYSSFSFTDADTSKDYFFNKLSGEKFENFCVAFLNTQHGLIECETMFTGTIDAAAVYPRVIAQRALELNSAAIVIAHNHPSGIASPSMADEKITKKIKEALGLFEIKVLDHIIVGDTPYSFAENGII